MKLETKRVIKFPGEPDIRSKGMEVEVKLTERMIHVMQAFTEGKKIEWRSNANPEGNWIDTTAPAWDWCKCDYRVKPDVQYRPYKDTEEMLDDFCERFPVKRTDYGEPFIWIKSKCGIKYLIEVITDSNVWTVNNAVDMYDLFKKYTYKDGSPCGKKE